MEIRRWKVIDIYYKKGEERKANKLADFYTGYTREDCDGYDEWEGSIQLISTAKITESRTGKGEYDNINRVGEESRRDTGLYLESHT